MVEARRRRTDKYVPGVYLLMAFALVIAFLPTALRPPSDRPNSTAEFAPDAPPDDNNDSLVSVLNRGQTATAGSGTSDGVGEGIPEIPPLVAEAEIARAPARSCQRGFGKPPRQTESLYGPPCAEAFTDSNGGATWHGVTATEVHVAVAMANAATTTSYEGPVPTTEQSNESATERTYRVLQTWANESFQLFGRQLRLFALKPPTGDTNEAQSRANASGAYERYNLFGSVTIGNQYLCDEFDRLKSVNFCDVAKPPVTFSWRMDLDRSARLSAEYACKSLVNRPASFTTDPTMNGKTRKLGVVYITNTTKYADADRLMRRYLKEECGATIDSSVNINGSGDPSNAGTVVTKLRSAGITTVFSFMDWVTSVSFTTGLDAQGYYPEIWVPGMGQLDVNYFAKPQNQAVWRHAMGLSSLEMVHPFETTDCYRAYKSVDPDGDPDYTLCGSFFPPFLQMLSGLQSSGPELTPATFERGLFGVGYRYYDSPRWAVGGGYGPGDYSYAKDVTQIWWDSLAPNPDTGDGTTGTPGAYRFVQDGRRFKVGEMPEAESLMFSDGVTSG